MRTVFVVLTLFSSLLGITGVLLNFLVCLVYFTNTRLLDAPNLFILNITLGDLLYSLVACPMLAASNARGEWLFGDAGCTASGFIATFFALGAMMNLVGAAYERYTTICKLFDDGEAQFSRRKALLLIGFFWCYSFFWSVLPVLGWSSYVQEGVGTSCSIHWKSGGVENVSYAAWLTLSCYVVPVAVIVFCFYKTRRTVQKLSERARVHWGENSIATQETIAAETKMTRIAFVMTTAFMFAWTPYAVTSTVAMYNPNLISDIGASIPAYFAKFSACYNPFIYLFMYRKLRKAMKKVLYCGSRT